MQTPVLLLFFNRPDAAATLIERLRVVAPTKVYVHIDGPRPDKPGEMELVAACHALLATIDWPCTITTLIREKNQGLRAGVYDAINWFFKAELEGIILEDDCLPDVSFFPFCQALLDEYRDDPKVMHIAGSNVAADAIGPLKESYVFSRFSLVWGWATWRRAWLQMSIDLDGLEHFIEFEGVKSLLPSRMAQVYMLNKFRITRQGLNRSWAYAWFYSILNAGGLCIIPTKNLIENVGIGKTDATNTTATLRHLQKRAAKMSLPLHAPGQQVPNPRYELIFFYYTQKQKWRLIIWYILHLLGLR